MSFCRDVSTGTQLVQYKTNSSGRNRFCKLGNDYFVAAQNGKDSVHFWTWHKVRCCCVSFGSSLGARPIWVAAFGTQQQVASMTAL
jgi:hypothetical protein